MDFIIGLSESEEYNIIIIYINYFTKIRHFIIIRNDISTQDITYLFINNVYALYGFPKIIMSDYGP